MCTWRVLSYKAYTTPVNPTTPIPTVQMGRLRHGGPPLHRSQPCVIGSWYTCDISCLHRGCQVLGRGGPSACLLPLASWAQSCEKQAPHKARPTGQQSSTLPTMTIHFYPQDTLDSNCVAFPHQQPNLQLSRHTWLEVLPCDSVLTLSPDLAQSAQVQGSVPGENPYHPPQAPMASPRSPYSGPTGFESGVPTTHSSSSMIC